MEEEKKQLKTKATIQKDGDRLIAIASEAVEDREGEVLTMEGWKIDNFKKNPVLLWGHNAEEPAIGKADNIKKKLIDGVKRLVFEPVFHGLSERSQLLEKLYKTGFLNSFSVGFLPLEKEGNKYTKQELLEISCVNVPALPSATIQARMKKFGIEEKDLAILTKPYPAEHSCRLKSPDQYEKFARKNCEAKSGDNCIDFIYGIKDGKSELQAMRFDKAKWDAGEARSYCEEKKGSFEPAKGTAEAPKVKPKEISKEEIKKPLTPPCGGKEVVKKEDEKDDKGQKLESGNDSRRLITIALKALEVGYQQPEQQRRSSKVAYKALEIVLTDFKKNGKEKRRRS
jgi:hypothetical protein